MLSKLVFLLFILPLCLTLKNHLRIQKNSHPLKLTNCTTSNGDFGKCMKVTNCPSYNFGRTGKKVQENSLCGKSKVCCDKYSPLVRKRTKAKPSITKSPSIEEYNDLFPKICGNQTLMQMARIVGGKGSSIGEFPWMARLKHRSKSGYETIGCVGFLISERFVITAAHCIMSRKLAHMGPLYQVQLGEHNTERDPDFIKFAKRNKCAPTPQVLRAAKPIVHPEYRENSNHYHDVAVIPLKETANFTRFVFPICLAKHHLEENTFWLSGWGATSHSESSRNKRKVSILATNQERCKKKYEKVNVNIRNSQICAGGQGGRDSCSGDSGGPLMVKNGTRSWYAVGIVSFGLGCGLQGWPGIYTDIPYYYPWIVKVTSRYTKKHVTFMK